MVHLHRCSYVYAVGFVKQSLYKKHHGLHIPDNANTAVVTVYKCVCLLLVGVRCSLKSVGSTLGEIFPCIFLIEK